MTYQDFLNKKQISIPAKGFDVFELNPMMKDFQKFCTRTALHKGRFALFEDCGLGKTFQALEWSYHISRLTGKPVLNLAPLAVTNQTIKEGVKFGIEVNEVGSGNIQISNFEQLENIDTSIYSGIVIDESSILKNYEGSYRNLIIDRFQHTPYKLACTATPSPNDPMELGNHAEFLGVMKRSEMLATYFVHDGGETSKWRLKRHAIDTFWQWVNSWSLMFSKPSDIGFDDEGYILPELNFIERQIATPVKDGKVYNETALSSTEFHAEVRLTQVQRLSEVIDIVNNSDESFIIWIEQTDDGDYLRKRIEDAIEVKGSDSPEYKKDKLLGFAEDKFRILITKPKIAAYGLNYQNCHNMVFASPDFSFEKMYQAIRRELRYGQQHPVNAYVVTTDTMQNVITTFKRKQRQHLEMQHYMTKHTSKLYEQYRKAA